MHFFPHVVFSSSFLFLLQMYTKLHANQGEQVRFYQQQQSWVGQAVGAMQGIDLVAMSQAQQVAALQQRAALVQV